jgi:serine/threonine protein kinase
MSPVTLLIAGGIAFLLLLVLLMKNSKKGKDQAGDFLNRVREYVEKGDFRGAANLQRNHGNHKEAYNLLERGKHHMEAAKLAETQGWFDKAAKNALSAGQFEWAAELYMQAKDPEQAAKLFARAGKHIRAAELLEQLGSGDWPLLAQCWEKALLQMLPSDQNLNEMAQDFVRKIYLTAEKAAEAYQKAGNPERAALIYDACQQKDKAETIRRSSTLMGGIGGMGGMGGDPLSTMAGHTPSMGGGQTIASDPNLALLSKVVDQAVSRAMSDNQHSAQIVVNNQPMTGMPLMGNTAGGVPGATQVQIIYVPDGTGKTTAIRTETDRYEILDKLGEGGMAVVYKAIDKTLEREVALKFLPEGVTQSAQSYELFEREAKSAAGINHPNIITIYDFGELEGRPFICMELLDGLSLDELLQKLPGNRVPLNSFFEIFDELLSALETAHGRSLVHRDIKPSNMMLTRQKLIKLMDFGIAKEINPEKSTMIAGTPYYMAPEQFSGKGIDHRADLFAVGVTMYLCLTGKLPFEGFMRIEPPKPPSEWARVPASLDKVVMWCMAFEPDKRPQSSYDLLQNLRRIHRELKRDPMWAQGLSPEGQDSFVSLLGPGFFQKANSPRTNPPQRVGDSSATIASFHSHSELPAAGNVSSGHLPSARDYSRPMIASSSRGSLPSVPTVHEHQRQQRGPAPGQRAPSRPSGGVARVPSSGLRHPSTPNIPRVRGGQRPPQRHPQHTPVVQGLPLEDNMTMVEHSGEETMMDPRGGFQQRGQQNRRTPSVDDLLSGYVDKK